MNKRLIYLRGSTWYTDVRVKGKRVRVSTGCTDRTEALATAAKIQAGEIAVRGLPGASKELHGSGPGLTLKDAVALAWKTRWRRLKDAQMPRLHSAELVDMLGPDFKVGRVDDDLIADLIDRWQARGNSDSTINKKLSALSSILKAALGDHKAPRMPRFKEGSGRPFYLDDAQCDAVINSETDPMRRAMWVVLAFTGLRIGEALMLTWDLVDWQDRLLGVGRDWGDTKGDKIRTVPMHPMVIEALQTVKDAGMSTPFSWRGYQTWRKWFHLACQNAKVDLPPGVACHIMRHSCATNLIALGLDVREVQEVLGHSDVRLTQRYAKVKNIRLRNAMDRLYSSRPPSSTLGERDVSPVCHPGVPSVPDSEAQLAQQPAAHPPVTSRPGTADNLRIPAESTTWRPAERDGATERSDGEVAEWSNAPDSKSPDKLS